MVLSFRKIKYCLENIESCRAYYVGASLCIDMMPTHPNIVLNRNGRGFAYNGSSERKFVVSPTIHNLVLEQYQRKLERRNERRSRETEGENQ